MRAETNGFGHRLDHAGLEVAKQVVLETENHHLCARVCTSMTCGVRCVSYVVCACECGVWVWVCERRDCARARAMF